MSFITLFFILIAYIISCSIINITLLHILGNETYTKMRLHIKLAISDKLINAPLITYQMEPHPRIGGSFRVTKYQLGYNEDTDIIMALIPWPIQINRFKYRELYRYEGTFEEIQNFSSLKEFWESKDAYYELKRKESYEQTKAEREIVDKYNAEYFRVK
jgi:hypothetical protein